MEQQSFSIAKICWVLLKLKKLFGISSVAFSLFLLLGETDGHEICLVTFSFFQKGEKKANTFFVVVVLTVYDKTSVFVILFVSEPSRSG
jgi:hypothetical protein